MAQPKLDKISLELGTKMGDTPSSATADGETYTKNDRLSYINLARKHVFIEMLAKYQGNLQEFGKVFNEWVIGDTVSISSNLGALPAGLRHIMNAYLSVNNVKCKVVDSEKYHEAKFDTDSHFFGTDEEPAVYVSRNQIELLRETTTGTPNLYLKYIGEPVDAVHDGSTDIPDPESWTQMIVQTAYEIFRTDQLYN